MKPVLLVLLLASALAGCAMPEPIPYLDNGDKTPPDGALGLVDSGPRDVSIHNDRVMMPDMTPIAPAGDGSDGVLTRDGLPDGLVDGGTTAEAGKKKDGGIKPKG